MASLAQAYIHLKPYSASTAEIQSLGRYLKDVSVRSAGEIYGGDVQVEIQIEEGSLITRVTVVGSILLGIYGFVANYKGFKEGVVEMCNDAREFAVDVCAPFIKKAGVPREEVFRFERRLKTPGKLYRLSRRLEKLEQAYGDLSAKDIQRELANLRVELETIAQDLSPLEREALQPALRKPNLPPPEKWPVPEEPRIAIREDSGVDQALLFEAPADTAPTERRPKIIFRETATVPRGSIGRRSRRLRSARPDLLAD